MKRIALTAAVLAAALASTASAAAPTLTLTAGSTVVNYGSPLTLSGLLAPAKANQSVTVDAAACGTSRTTKAASAKTTATGAYSTPVTPSVGTTYQASFKNAKSAAIAITVRPVLALTKGASHSWTAKVTAGQSLTGKAVLFQRYAKARKRWMQVKRVLLGAAAAGPKPPTMVTSATFTSKLARGTRVRVMISAAQAAPCYVSATSATLRA
jgi:hypothetical protein